MKWIIIFALGLSFSLQSEEGDFTYDKKSKSVIPKYLGKAFLVKNQPIVVNGNKERTLKKGDKVYKTETIKTDKKSIAKIEMVDKTIVTVAPASEIVFSRFDYKTKSNRKSVIRMATGKMRAYYKVKADKDADLKINVRHLAMGIRGTKVLANAYEINGKQIAQVALISGKSIVYDRVFDRELRLKAGEEYISVIDYHGKKVKNLKRPISTKDLDYLLALDKNPNKYFKPFLAPVGLPDLGIKLEKKANQAQKNMKEKSRIKGRMNQNDNPSWKKTLNKLNNKLQENQDEE